MEIALLEKELIALRHELHRFPEPSGEEYKTSGIIASYLERYGPDEIIRNLGGQGLAAIFNGQRQGPSVIFRCELDALPITELNDVVYKSENEGTGHLCGHDGHMSIVAGLAYFLSERRPQKGKVILLFQPSEENGQGARLVIEDRQFGMIKPDYTFALHNLPKYNFKEVITRYPVFAASSRGLSVNLVGKSSHAAEPESGKNPSNAVSRILMEVNSIMSEKDLFKTFTLITPIHIKVGALAFGTSPGYGEMHFTLRSFSEDDINRLASRVLKIIDHVVEDEELAAKVNFHEEFPITSNDKESIQIIRKAAEREKLIVTETNEAFKWSEDFGHFTNISKGAMFGLGAGKESPALHNPDYDFPDELILTGVGIFRNIYNDILNQIHR